MFVYLLLFSRRQEKDLVIEQQSSFDLIVEQLHSILLKKYLSNQKLRAPSSTTVSMDIF